MVRTNVEERERNRRQEVRKKTMRKKTWWRLEARC